MPAVKLAKDPTRPVANDSIFSTVIRLVTSDVSKENPKIVVLSSNHRSLVCSFDERKGTSSVNDCKFEKRIFETMNRKVIIIPTRAP
jgi:hypothetical protein